MKSKSRYSTIIEHIFNSKYGEGLREVEFLREELVTVARKLKIKLPKNLGDLIYSFRYRAELPEAIRKKAGVGETWIIRPAGTGKYRFVLVPDKPLLPNSNLAVTKVPDATPAGAAATRRVELRSSIFKT